jgi:hypothetical protein
VVSTHMRKLSTRVVTGRFYRYEPQPEDGLRQSSRGCAESGVRGRSRRPLELELRPDRLPQLSSGARGAVHRLLVRTLAELGIP